MTEWKKYSDTKEINDEMLNAKDGCLVRFSDGDMNDLRSVRLGTDNGVITHYLICEPQSHSEMQAIWVKTGQPVEVDELGEWVPDEYPEWKACLKYRFEEPKKEVIYYRDYLISIFGRSSKRTINKDEPHSFSPQQVEGIPEFVKWIDIEWQELEV